MSYHIKSFSLNAISSTFTDLVHGLMTNENIDNLSHAHATHKMAETEFESKENSYNH